MSLPCSQIIERVTEKAETDPARAGITSAADPVEGLEHLLPLAPRNSKAFVFDEDHNAIGPGFVRCLRYQSARPNLP
jgi:hypothetical protein